MNVTAQAQGILDKTAQHVSMNGTHGANLKLACVCGDDLFNNSFLLMVSIQLSSSPGSRCP